MSNPLRLGLSLSLVAVFTLSALAESLETQSNPVTSGQIQVATDDADRSDWDGIPWYEFDDDFQDFYPVDIDRVQLAHDANNLYIHIQAIEWDVDETWRVGTYLDTDQDPTTGYTGNFLPVGADHFIEDALSFAFAAATQAEWGWQESGAIIRDQSTMVDVEMAIPRSSIGNPAAFDFILFANNFCCDFQLPDDIYPNAIGGVFTYELGQVAGPTCDPNTAGDLDGNGQVEFGDFLILADHFGSDAVDHTTGDIDCNGRVEFSDFLILAENFGTATGEVASIPEPAAFQMLVLSAAGILFLRPRR